MRALSTPDYSESVGFVLRQLGCYSTTVFAEQLATIGLTLTHAGMLRAIAAEPGCSQHDLSACLGLVPGRLVGYLDDLEERGYIERRRNTGDRRRNDLQITEAGRKVMRKIAGLAREHDDELTAGLDPEKCCAFRDVLSAVAQQLGLTPHIRPGYHALDRWVAHPRR